MKEALAVFATGGTFDKEYHEQTGRLYFQRTHVGEMLKLGRARLKIRVTTLMLKDSLYMTAADRKRILAACRRAPESRIVITHGTDTMADTARFLAEQVGEKTVVLTGAMVPYRFGSSDGLFNLGGAVALAQVLPAGVYIAMNGRCFDGRRVKKNRRGGYFVESAPSRGATRSSAARSSFSRKGLPR